MHWASSECKIAPLSCAPPRRDRAAAARCPKRPPPERAARLTREVNGGVARCGKHMRRTHRLSPSLGLEAAGTAGQRDASQRLEFSLQRLTCAENRLDVVAAPLRPAAAHARGRAASRALGSGAARRAASRGRPAPRGAEANADGRAARLLPRAMARPRCSRGARTAHQHHMATREASAARACSSFTRPCATRKAPAARAAGAHASAPQAHARLPSQTGRASSMRRTTRPSAGAGRPL